MPGPRHCRLERVKFCRLGRLLYVAQLTDPRLSCSALFFQYPDRVGFHQLRQLVCFLVGSAQRADEIVLRTDIERHSPAALGQAAGKRKDRAGLRFAIIICQYARFSALLDLR